MYTIGNLCKMFNISRSTIIYYDKIGLLKPTSRSVSNYRLYSEHDVNHLKSIMRHKEAGISLEDISKLLELKKTDVSEILTSRLKNIQTEISTLKKQEEIVLAVLMKEVRLSESRIFTSESWTELLISIGYTTEDLLHWHQEFEKDSPEEHIAFLKALGMVPDDISRFRLRFISIE